MVSLTNIQNVMRECDCGRERAINLLTRSGNEVRKAIERHRATMDLVNRYRPSSEDSEPVEIGPGVNESGRNSENGNCDEDESLNTPKTEDEQDLDTLPQLVDQILLGKSGAEAKFLSSKASHERLLRSSEDVITKTEIESSAADLESMSEKSLEGQYTSTKWDFILPLLPSPATLQPGIGEGKEGFSLPDLVGAVQNGADPQDILNYLGYYDEDTIRRNINGTVSGFPAMFFVLAANSDWILRTWVAFGGDVSAVHGASQVPLLAFAIMHAETIQTDTTEIVATLLSLGASAQVIPSAFYTPFSDDLPDKGPELKSLKDLSDENKKWCTEAAREKLARTMNITQRYYLERATKSKNPSVRHRQVAQLRNAEPLLGIPYFLIGQTLAANIVLQKLLSYIMIPSSNPLVLVFAGPSGHGKTELARRLGYLMSLDLEVVDCTSVKYKEDLYGARHPWNGGEAGSRLNNFLAKHTGQRSIVFLDEFEKTSQEIHQTLLLPFENGEYEDRRLRKMIDCSKTIWILATNAADPTIQRFCVSNDTALFSDDNESRKRQLMKSLSKEVKNDFLSIFGAPITGRISAFIPFLPFSPGEQAVIIHKYLLKLARRVRSRTNLSPGQKEQLLGNVHLRIRRDASVCRILAKSEYDRDLGARSLITAVRSVEALLVAAYLEVDEEITETDKVVDFVVDVNGVEVIADIVQPTDKGEN